MTGADDQLRCLLCLREGGERGGDFVPDDLAIDTAQVDKQRALVLEAFTAGG